MNTVSIPFVDESEWLKRTDPNRPIVEAWADPVWRIANAYSIRNDQGDVIKFIPTREQRVIIWDIHVRGYKNILIPKARKLGMSTVLCVIGADMMGFSNGVEVALVDRTQPDAEKKLRNMVKFTYESLPSWFRSSIKVESDNKGEFSIAPIKSTDKRDMSIFEAGVSFRGGTPQFLIVSEWGATQYDDPSRSREIKTGAMVAAKFGIRVIETTWKGGACGDVWSYVELANMIPEERKTKSDWRIRFFPWYIDLRNSREGDVEFISKEVNEYLEGKELETGHKFTDKQKLWYYFEKLELGLDMARENPTTIDECWSVPIEGAIYADLLDKLAGAGQITNFDYDPNLEVDTFWDLGAPENTVVWYVQRKGDSYQVIDCDHKLALTTTSRVKHMKSKSFVFGSHYLPHDGASNQKGGLSFQEELSNAGLEGIRVVQRTNDPEIGIDRMRRLLLNFKFHKTNCDAGIAQLKMYRRKVDHAKDPTPHIVHDNASHYADALRTLAEAEGLGMLTKQGGRRFDVEGLETLDKKALLKNIQYGYVEDKPHGTTFTTVFKDDAWMSFVERPEVRNRYLLAVSHVEGVSKIGVFKVSSSDKEDISKREVTLVAAHIDDEELDLDVIAKRVKALSSFYGDCQVVILSEDVDSVYEILMDANVENLWRMIRSGMGKTKRRLGWSYSDDLTAPIKEISRRIREELVDIYDPDARGQLAQFMRTHKGNMAAIGHSDDWVKLIAVAVQCIESSEEYRPASQRRNPYGSYDYNQPYNHNSTANMKRNTL